VTECYRLGFSFTPLAGKKPTLNNWPALPRETEADALAWDAGNIGIRCGAASGGLIVIDVDAGGDVAALGLPETVTARTGGGGFHYFFKCAQPLKNTAGKLGLHIDTRGDGGQVVAPGSIHPETGVMYEWVDGREPWSIAVADLPQAIAERLNAPRAEKPANVAPTPKATPRGEAAVDRYIARAIKFEVHAVATAVEGTRNNTLNSAALSLGGLVAGGYVPRSEIESALIDAALSAGLPLDEAAATIRSGLEAAKPRDVQAEMAKRPTRKVRKAATPTPEHPGMLPEIKLGVDEFRVIEDTITALRSDSSLYSRGNLLVRTIRDAQPKDGIVRAGGSATIQAVPLANLRERITRYAAFTKVDKNGEEIPAHPPAWLIQSIHVRADWPGIRPLYGISDAPILRPDGSIWQTPGYDDRTGVVFDPAGATFPTISDEATLNDAGAATARILDVWCDFCFESPEHRAACLAALLTPLSRYAFTGPSPLNLFDANVRGSGKSLLAGTIGRIVLGREMPVSSYSHDSGELRKRITAIAMAGDRVIVLDNLDGVFGNDALDRAVTATVWKDRILGESREIEAPLLATWYATGNNIQVSADTTRRIIHIRLDVLNERPEERGGFKHPDLLAWVSENRPTLLADALTIVSAYIRAGKPRANLKPFGSFEGWSDLVRQAVVWVGLPDPCLTRTKLVESADTTADTLAQLIDAWEDYAKCWPDYHAGTIPGMTIANILGHLYRGCQPSDAASVAMRAAIEGLIGCPPGRVPTARQFGFKLRSFKRRVIGNRYLDIDAAANDRSGATWQLRHTAQETMETMETMPESIVSSQSN
jgi:hypothetical protein